MGHVGLTPQAISVIGGFRAQGRTATRARALLDDAMRLQDAGAFAIVLECVPGNVAKAITESLEIPTIGIGAGPWTSGTSYLCPRLLQTCILTSAFFTWCRSSPRLSRFAGNAFSSSSRAVHAQVL